MSSTMKTVNFKSFCQERKFIITQDKLNKALYSPHICDLDIEHELELFNKNVIAKDHSYAVLNAYIRELGTGETFHRGEQTLSLPHYLSSRLAATLRWYFHVKACYNSELVELLRAIIFKATRNGASKYLTQDHIKQELLQIKLEVNNSNKKDLEKAKILASKLKKFIPELSVYIKEEILKEADHFYKIVNDDCAKIINLEEFY